MSARRLRGHPGPSDTESRRTAVVAILANVGVLGAKAVARPGRVSVELEVVPRTDLSVEHVVAQVAELRRLPVLHAGVSSVALTLVASTFEHDGRGNTPGPYDARESP